MTADPTPGQPYFDGDRFWAASWAEAETTQDLDPDPSFSAANRNRSRARALSAVAVALSAVLLLLTGAAVSRGRAACVLCRVAAPLFFLSGLAAVLLEVLL